MEKINLHKNFYVLFYLSTVACERAFTYNIFTGRLENNFKKYIIYMTHQEYLKQIQAEIRRLNRIIDYKILNGEKYFQEAKDHKYLLEKIRKHQPVKSSFFSKFFPMFYSH